jgi:N-acetyl sugar amidotransferase
MTLCKLCIYPDTRPDANFVDGVCSACRSYAERSSINWPARKLALLKLLDSAKNRGSQYDCVVPVSGGKDSTYQVISLIEMGAKVLAVNAGTDMLSAIGRRNLDNLKRFCDVIEWVPNIEVRKKLVRIGLRMVGDLSWPEHMAIWAIPTRVACMMKIPLVIWGEQPQREYANPADVPVATTLDSAWVAQFGGMLGLRLSDVIGIDGLTDRDLSVFRFPSDAQLDAAGVEGIWLGDYIDWDGWRNAFIAQQYGFEVAPSPVETSLANYENLDSHATVLRDYLRWLKYGYTRAVDIACNHIRRGRLTREEGIVLAERAGHAPLTSLGMPLVDVLSYFGISLNEWESECQRWSAK